MLHFDIISCLPELLRSPFEHSILKRAQQKGLVSIHIHNLRDYGLGRHKQIDDYQYGGGAGMVMMIEPLSNCIKGLQKDRAYDEIIYVTPDGEQLNQQIVNQLSLANKIMIISGHYKGIDQRVRDQYITREISIGDYVLSGGELPAAILVDSISRVVPGVLNDGSSALTDSFQDDLLAPPVYTRPAEYDGMKVPEVLLSGNDAKIEEWRYQQALAQTKKRRPELLDK